MKQLLRLATLAAALLGCYPLTASSQVSLVFNADSLHSGTALQSGAVYCFTDVTGTTDAEVEIVALANGATLTQVDDSNSPTPSSAPLQPQMSATPNLEGRVDFAITLVDFCGGSAGTITGLEISAIDIDGASGRQEFVELSGVSSYTLEGTPASLLTVSTNERGLRFTGPETTFSGIDPTITEVIAVANGGSTSRIELSIGQTGTGTTAGNRLFSLDFTIDAVTFTDPQVSNLAAQIGTAMSVGTIINNGDGTYDVPLTVTLEGFSDVSLFDLQITDDLATSFGTYVSATPTVPGTYTVTTPTIGALTGGAVIAAGSPNASFNGSTDQNLLNLVAGNRLPVGATAQISFTVTWYPTGGTTSTTNQATGRGDFSENGTSEGSSTDLSHEGNDPDPDLDGPANNSTVTSIDLGGLPVELADFTAVSNGTTVALIWKTYSETGNSGFDIEHRGPYADEGVFQTVGFVQGAGQSQSTISYRFELSNLEAGAHQFRLRQKDFDGSLAYSQVLTIDVEMADQFVLGAAYPNPFNPTTTIRFAIKEKSHVRLDVFDVTGRNVRSLVNGLLQAGNHEARFEASALPSGLYLYRLVTDTGSASKPMVLLK